MSDRIFAALVLILAAAYGVHAMSFKPPPIFSDAVGPSGFPYILAIAMAAAAILIIVRPDAEPAWPRRGRLAQMALVTALLLIYTMALEDAGFIIATLIAVTALSWRMGARPAHSLGIGVGVAVGLFVLVDLVLGLPLPGGPLDFI